MRSFMSFQILGHARLATRVDAHAPRSGTGRVRTLRLNFAVPACAGQYAAIKHSVLKRRIGCRSRRLLVPASWSRKRAPTRVAQCRTSRRGVHYYANPQRKLWLAMATPWPMLLHVGTRSRRPGAGRRF